MKRLAIVGFLLIGTGGCLQPVRVITEDHLRFDNPVTAEFAPTNNAHPIVAMPVEGGATVSRSPHVAIIDVDGLLLNTNLAGPYSSGDNPVDVFREKLDFAAADQHAVAVVVRINSPGGSVTASDIMWRDLQRFREK